MIDKIMLQTDEIGSADLIQPDRHALPCAIPTRAGEIAALPVAKNLQLEPGQCIIAA
ncbi:hypothetical protein HED48_09725 [Ochrobactrum intermedium]|nr:hypothetical protein [Brucella intermedia]